MSRLKEFSFSSARYHAMVQFVISFGNGHGIMYIRWAMHTSRQRPFHASGPYPRLAILLTHITLHTCDSRGVFVRGYHSLMLFIRSTPISTYPPCIDLLVYSPNNLLTLLSTLSLSGSYGWSLDGISSNEGKAAVYVSTRCRIFSAIWGESALVVSSFPLPCTGKLPTSIEAPNSRLKLHVHAG